MPLSEENISFLARKAGMYFERSFNDVFQRSYGGVPSTSVYLVEGYSDLVNVKKLMQRYPYDYWTVDVGDGDSYGYFVQLTMDDVDAITNEFVSLYGKVDRPDPYTKEKQSSAKVVN